MTYSLLSGLRVLEIGSMISAPYCGKLLADAGAGVLKIEPPGVGEDARRYGPWPDDVPHPERSGLYLYLNANKAGITANLETPTGRGILRQLAAKSDVVVHNVPPAEMERLGLDYDLLAAEHPELVMASISPWGLVRPVARLQSLRYQPGGRRRNLRGAGRGRPGAVDLRHPGGRILRRDGRRLVHRDGAAGS